jgi:hypothetical protein
MEPNSGHGKITASSEAVATNEAAIGDRAFIFRFNPSKSEEDVRAHSRGAFTPVLFKRTTLREHMRACRDLPVGQALDAASSVRGR